MTQLINNIWQANKSNFEHLALAVFNFQYQNNTIYKQYVDAINCNVSNVQSLVDIPYLPIQFFKTHNIICNNFTPEIIFKSSGTGNSGYSKHLIAQKELYIKSFTNGFKQAFGEAKNYLILGLLPNYVEQGDSSLVYMVNYLMQQSAYPQSKMYLYNMQELAQTLQWAQQQNTPTILFGVTYALLQFAEKHPMQLPTITIIETGGMKGRGQELTREILHQKLSNAFSVKNICSEYGMTELLSQAYSLEQEIFTPSNTMKILVRDLYDPFDVKLTQKGGINIIDLANIYSCSFIATQDQGAVFSNGNFTITGRLDNTDMRGCNLLV